MRGPGGWGVSRREQSVQAVPHWIHSSAPQLEKVLQQGDISECCEPYMVMKEVDTAKVSVWGLKQGQARFLTQQG